MTVSDIERDARFMRSVLAASEDCIKVIGLDGTLTFMSEGGQRVMEVSDFNAIRGCPWPDFWQDQGNTEAKLAIEAARGGKSSRFQGFADTAKGNRKFWDVQVSPIFGADGQPENILSVSRDITALKLAEERQKLLGKELSHRIKNTIALVQAIANQTLRAGDTMEVAKAAFLARLSTMSNAQDILTQDVWERALLRPVVVASIEPYQPERFQIDGPDVELSSKSVLAMGLALHELATNATKYGALSNDTGRVLVQWSIDGSGDARRFRFRWEEQGGPPIRPVSHRGFGSRMIERALAAYVRGVAKVDYPVTGVVFTLETSPEALAAD